MLRARLTGPTTIDIDRSTNGTPDEPIPAIGWQAIELRDGSRVQSGSENFPVATGTRTVTLGTSVDPTAAVAFASVQPAGGQNMGRTPYTANDILGVGSVTMALTSPTQVTMIRNKTADTADIGWFVVHFKKRRAVIID
jgi:hypothetical protein